MLHDGPRFLVAAVFLFVTRHYIFVLVPFLLFSVPVTEGRCVAMFFPLAPCAPTARFSFLLFLVPDFFVASWGVSGAHQQGYRSNYMKMRWCTGWIWHHFFGARPLLDSMMSMSRGMSRTKKCSKNTDMTVGGRVDVSRPLSHRTRFERGPAAKGPSNFKRKISF